MAAATRVGEMLDERYWITALLGEGGMGQVYEGLQVALERKVAVKVLHPRLAYEESSRERFLREARSASRIQHPNVVQILDFGDTVDGVAYFVMELLEGRDLRALLNEVWVLPWPRAQPILLQAVRALRAAHAKDIIHRDIKPGNCFVFDSPDTGSVDNVKLLDFGIAKLAVEPNEGDPHSKSLTGTGEVFGTASYMAPEHARGATLDARSDIYSLGIMAYEMLTGSVPFTGVNSIQVITRHLTDSPRPLRDVNPRIPPDVEALVLKAIAKFPEDRFQSMAELEDELVALSVSPREATQVATPTPSGTVQPRRRPPPQANTTIDIIPPTLAGPPEPPSADPHTPPVPAAKVPLVQPPRPRPPSGSTLSPRGARGAASGAPSVPELAAAAELTDSSRRRRGGSETPGARASLEQVDASTSSVLRAELASPLTGPLPRQSAQIQLADTSPYSLPAPPPPSTRLRIMIMGGLFGVVVVCASVAVTIASVYYEDQGTIGEARHESQPTAPSAVETETPAPTRSEPPRGGVPEPLTGNAPPVVVAPKAMVDEIDETDETDEIDETDDTILIDDALEGEASPDVEPGSEVAQAPSESPARETKQARKQRRKADQRVKDRLVQAIQRECGGAGAGARVVATFTVGSQGTILFKTIDAQGPVKACVAKLLSKAKFPAAVPRKLAIEVDL